MKKNKYIYASLGGLDFLFLRLGGPGLCNLLFVWSRMIILSKKYNLKIIPTTWFSLKIGPYLRRELDKRSYKGFFCPENNTCFLKKTFLLIFKKKQVLKVHNNKVSFDDLIPYREFIFNKLLNIIHKKYLKTINSFNGDGVVVHIRMGDFKSGENENQIREGAWNMRISLKWYKSIIEKLVSINKDINVYVFSDAANKELKEILDIHNVKRCYFGSAISDLLALSRGKILIASASTFSMWASFLGQNHTIWFPGQRKFKIIQNKNIFEGELDYSDSLPKNIINYVSK